MVKVGIVGSTGRMGAHLIKNVLEDDSLRLSVLHIFDELKVSVPEDVILTNSMDEVLTNSDVVIDFSAPIATQSYLRELRESKTLVVVQLDY